MTENRNEKWASGDRAVAELEAKFRKISSSDDPFERKLERMGDALREAFPPWDMKGDDRVLSMMSIAAIPVVESLVDADVARIKAMRHIAPEEREALLLGVQKAVESLPWLAKAAKSSIGCKLAFARYDVRHKEL